MRRVITSSKSQTRHITGNDPVDLVNNLANAQVGADAAKHVGVFRVQLLLPAYQIDHPSDSILGPSIRSEPIPVVTK